MLHAFVLRVPLSLFCLVLASKSLASCEPRSGLPPSLSVFESRIAMALFISWILQYEPIATTRLKVDSAMQEGIVGLKFPLVLELSVLLLVRIVRGAEVASIQPKPSRQLPFFWLHNHIFGREVNHIELSPRASPT